MFLGALGQVCPHSAGTVGRSQAALEPGVGCVGTGRFSSPAPCPAAEHRLQGTSHRLQAHGAEKPAALPWEGGQKPYWNSLPCFFAMCLHLNWPACECWAEHGTNPVGSSSFGRALPQSEIFFFFLYLPHALNPKRAAGSSRAGVGQSSCVALPWDGGFGDGRPAGPFQRRRPSRPPLPSGLSVPGHWGAAVVPRGNGEFWGEVGGVDGKGTGSRGPGAVLAFGSTGELGFGHPPTPD